MELNKIHESYSRIWAMFNTLRRAGFTSEAWEACVNESHTIGTQGGEMAQGIILAVISEAESEAKMSPEDRKAAYKTAAAAFNGSWELLKNLTETDDFSTKGIQLLAEYDRKFPESKFAETLGNVVYKEACGRVKDDFISVALNFYEKYRDGITGDNKAAAFKDAERIINVNPEYTLHVMELLSGLQKTGEKAGGKAAA